MGQGPPPATIWQPRRSKSKLSAMNKLLAFAVVAALAAAAGAWAADKPQPSNGLWTMQCIQEGVAQGFRGKVLEDFVSKCIRAKASGGGKDDSTLPPGMANC
jgi:hypothetical protein